MNVSHNTVLGAWDSYYHDIMKPAGVQVGSAQYIETRRAFYAAANAFMAIMSNIADMSDEAGEAVLCGLEAELKLFGSMVGTKGF